MHLFVTFGTAMEDLLLLKDGGSAFELWLHAHLLAQPSYFNAP